MNAAAALGLLGVAAAVVAALSIAYLERDVRAPFVLIALGIIIISVIALA